MEPAVDVVIQAALELVALAMLAAVCGLLGFGLGVCLALGDDIQRGLSNGWMFLSAEVNLDKEEKRNEKQARKAAAMAAARRRRTAGKRRE